MALPSSGSISMSQVATELGVSAVGINLNQANVRALAGRNSGTISMSNLHGKSSFSISTLDVRTAYYSGASSSVVGRWQYRFNMTGATIRSVQYIGAVADGLKTIGGVTASVEGTNIASFVNQSNWLASGVRFTFRVTFTNGQVWEVVTETFSSTVTRGDKATNWNGWRASTSHTLTRVA